MAPAGIIERAYQLAAQSGSLEEIRRKLVDEGYFNVHAHLGGRQIRRDLVKRLNPKLARANSSSAAPRVARTTSAIKAPLGRGQTERI